MSLQTWMKGGGDMAFFCQYREMYGGSWFRYEGKPFMKLANSQLVEGGLTVICLLDGTVQSDQLTGLHPRAEVELLNKPNF